VKESILYVNKCNFFSKKKQKKKKVFKFQICFYFIFDFLNLTAKKNLIFYADFFFGSD